MIEKKLENFFSDQICILIILVACLITIILSNYVYTYEEILSKQDASEYIELANNPSSYFNLPHQGAVRIFPSLLVFSIKTFGFSTETVFKFLTYLSFIFLNLKIYFLFKNYNIKNYLILSAIAILVFSNHSVIYTVFNYFQLLDIFTYIFIIYFIQLTIKQNFKLLFFISLFSILTKEYLLILVIFAHLNSFLFKKEKKYLVSLILISIIFIIHFNLAASNNVEKNTSDILSLSSSYFQLYDTFLSSMYNALILNKNIFLFLPFLILMISKKFLILLIKNYHITIFTIIPLSFSIFLFNNTGNNFFRVFYHGYFIVVYYSIIFLLHNIPSKNINNFIFFISPLFFLIDYIFILKNINQSGFFDFFQNIRYEQISGYYIFNILIFILIILNFKSIFLSHKPK